MHLYPIPDVLVLADKFDAYNLTYDGCLAFNPGSFHSTDFAFMVYTPSKVPLLSRSFSLLPFSSPCGVPSCANCQTRTANVYFKRITWLRVCEAASMMHLCICYLLGNPHRLSDLRTLCVCVCLCVCAYALFANFHALSFQMQVHINPKESEEHLAAFNSRIEFSQIE